MVFTPVHQGRQHGIVVVPTPSFTQHVKVFHTFVGIQIAAYGVHPKRFHVMGKSTHVISTKLRIKAPNAVEIAREGAILYRSGVIECGFELITAPQLVECGDGCNHFHSAGGAHQLTLVVGVDDTIGREVVHHQSQLRGFKHVVRKQFVNSCLRILWPRQCHAVVRERVHQGHVGHFRTVIIRYVFVNHLRLKGHVHAQNKQTEKIF